MGLHRDFKGIWIPKEIWLEEQLTIQEKLFYVEIDSLDNEKGCFANNQHFAAMFNISKTRCSLVISSLEKKGYITSQLIYKDGTQQILNRVIKISYRPYTTKVKEGYTTKVKDPIQQKLKESNTLSNTSISNTINNTNNKELECEFEILWNLYPNKKGKEKAKKSYIKYRKAGTTYAEVEKGINAYVFFHKEKGTEPEFIKYGSTYFAGAIWNDDYTVIKKKSFFERIDEL